MVEVEEVEAKRAVTALVTTRAIEPAGVLCNVDTSISLSQQSIGEQSGLVMLLVLIMANTEASNERIFRNLTDFGSFAANPKVSIDSKCRHGGSRLAKNNLSVVGTSCANVSRSLTSISAHLLRSRSILGHYLLKLFMLSRCSMQLSHCCYSTCRCP